MYTDLVAARRSRGVIVSTTFDAGLTGKPHEKQLAFATATECVLYTLTAKASPVVGHRSSKNILL